MKNSMWAHASSDGWAESRINNVNCVSLHVWRDCGKLGRDTLSRLSQKVSALAQVPVSFSGQRSRRPAKSALRLAADNLQLEHAQRAQGWRF